MIRSATGLAGGADDRRSLGGDGAEGRALGLDFGDHLDIHLLHRAGVGGDIGERDAVGDDGDSGRSAAIGGESARGTAKTDDGGVITGPVEEALVAGAHGKAGLHADQFRGVTAYHGERVQIFGGDDVTSLASVEGGELGIRRGLNCHSLGCSSNFHLDVGEAELIAGAHREGLGFPGAEVGGRDLKLVGGAGRNRGERERTLTVTGCGPL